MAQTLVPSRGFLASVLTSSFFPSASLHPLEFFIRSLFPRQLQFPPFFFFFLPSLLSVLSLASIPIVLQPSLQTGLVIVFVAKDPQRPFIGLRLARPGYGGGHLKRQVKVELDDWIETK